MAHIHYYNDNGSSNLFHSSAKENVETIQSLLKSYSRKQAAGSHSLQKET